MNALLLIGFILATLPINSFAIDDNEQPETRSQNFAQHSSIKINLDFQKSSGIKSLKLSPSTYHAEFIAHGKVINIQALLTLRNRYQLVSAERNNIKAKLNASRTKLYAPKRTLR